MRDRMETGEDPADRRTEFCAQGRDFLKRNELPLPFPELCPGLGVLGNDALRMLLLVAHREPVVFPEQTEDRRSEVDPAPPEATHPDGLACLIEVAVNLSKPSLEEDP